MKNKDSLLKNKWASAIPFICAIIYFLLGYILKSKGVERPYICSLLVFIIIPISYIILGLKKPVISYPVLVTVLYFVVCSILQMSLNNGYWHPLWVMFLTIPIYYIFFGNRKIGEKKSDIVVDYDADK